MKTIVTRNGETIRSSCEPKDITYDRHKRTVTLYGVDHDGKETFTVKDDRLAWLENENTGLSEVLVELTVK